MCDDFDPGCMDDATLVAGLLLFLALLVVLIMVT